MTDVELDHDWQPNGRRPQSIMARSLAAALDEALGLDSETSELADSVNQKKQMVGHQARELQELQRRIRDAEDRLRASGSKVPDPVPESREHDDDDREAARAASLKHLSYDSSVSTNHHTDATDVTSSTDATSNDEDEVDDDDEEEEEDDDEEEDEEVEEEDEEEGDSESEPDKNTIKGRSFRGAARNLFRNKDR